MDNVIKTKLGTVTAYADAVKQGYKGTREEFGQVMAGFADSAKQVSLDAEEVRQNKEDITDIKSEVERLHTQTAQSATDASKSERNANASETAAKDAQTAAETAKSKAEQYKSSAEKSARDAENTKTEVSNIAADAKKQIDEYVKVKEEALKGEPGQDGVTPRIGDNGNWFIGDTDTGINAHGIKGEDGVDGVDGVSPHIGENGHWYIGEADTGIPAQGADGEQGADGKSAYQYAQDGGYTGTEEEFAAKLATEYPTDVQIDGNSIVDRNGVAIVPIGNTDRLGVVKTSNYNIGGIKIENGNISINGATPNIIKNRISNLNNQNFPLIMNSLDYGVKAAMTDGIGAAWTDREKSGAWERLSSIKTAMDEVAVAGAHYYLPEQTELSITLPDDALAGQEITVIWYNGETPATLSISGNMLDFDYVPSANSRSEISALWDGTYWSLISNEQAIPVTTEEVVASE